MKNLKLSSKLIGGFLVMALMLLVGGLVGLAGIAVVKSHLGDFVNVRVGANQALYVIQDRQQNILAMEQSLLTPEILNDTVQKDQLLKGIEDEWKRAEAAWKQYDQIGRDDETEVLVKKAKPAWQAWRSADEELLGVIRQGNREEAARIMRSRVDEAASVSEKALKDLTGAFIKSDQAAAHFAIAQGSRLTVVALVGTFLGIILAIGLGFYFSRSITRPINHVIENLTQTAQQFAEAAAQIAQSSSHLAEGTSIQASAVEETYSVTEELKSSNAKYIEIIGELKGRLNGTNAIGMDAFETMKAAKKAMKGIKQTSEETSLIVQAIEKIAFQTNLLALNASVEAARAGDAGSGFTVVSDDIRGLGARSTEAAKNSIALIGKTAAIAGDGNDFIGLSIKKFIEYGTSSMNIYTYTEEAAKVARQQLDGVNQVNALMESISKSAQANAAAAQEASSVSEQTTAQAMSVQKVIRELGMVVGYTRQ